MAEEAPEPTNPQWCFLRLLVGDFSCIASSERIVIAIKVQIFLCCAECNHFCNVMVSAQYLCVEISVVYLPCYIIIFDSLFIIFIFIHEIYTELLVHIIIFDFFFTINMFEV